MVLLHAILDPKDEVIFPAPYWVSYPEMVKLAGGVPVLVTPEDGTFHPTIEDIAEAVGSVHQGHHHQQPQQPFRRDVLARSSSPGSCEFCEKKNLYLIMDDIYNRLVFDGQTPDQLLRVRQGPTEQLQADRHQLRLQDVRHDRLPHRLGRRQQGS